MIKLSWTCDLQILAYIFMSTKIRYMDRVFFLDEPNIFTRPSLVYAQPFQKKMLKFVMYFEQCGHFISSLSSEQVWSAFSKINMLKTSVDHIKIYSNLVPHIISIDIWKKREKSVPVISVFAWFLQRLALKSFFSIACPHILHLYGFSSMCSFRWYFNFAIFSRNTEKGYIDNCVYRVSSIGKETYHTV